MLCSWARNFTLTVPLSTQVYKRVPANLMLGVTLRWTSIPAIQGGVEILLVASCYRNWDKLRPDGPLGSNADFTFFLAGHSVAMVNYCVTKIIPTCSPVIGQFFDTMIVASVDKEWFSIMTHQSWNELETVLSHLKAE